MCIENHSNYNNSCWYLNIHQGFYASFKALSSTIKIYCITTSHNSITRNASSYNIVQCYYVNVKTVLCHASCLFLSETASISEQCQSRPCSEQWIISATSNFSPTYKSYHRCSTSHRTVAVLCNSWSICLLHLSAKEQKNSYDIKLVYTDKIRNVNKTVTFFVACTVFIIIILP